MTAKDYTSELWEALKQNHQNLIEHYSGKDGALRLAREYGCGLAGFQPAEQSSALRSSYSYLCVRFYNLRPPVSAKEWNKAILEGIAKAKAEPSQTSALHIE